MPLPQPAVWHDAIYRSICHMRCVLEGAGGVGDILDICGLQGQGCEYGRGC